MEFHECERCGGHALALQGIYDRHVCIDCIEEDGPAHRFICSIVGCRNQPIFLAVVESDKTASVLVCERHFRDVERKVTSYLQVPSWLTNGNDFHLGDTGVVFEFEVGPDNG
ncbi:MAG: hypothetical protein JSW25_08615 [Thermoplasmata archaeon]|nr:MAG: hypothetical protein JSW25_08615 [Thermoplasmata archaeon]